jgi:hypothetical protein
MAQRRHLGLSRNQTSGNQRLALSVTGRQPFAGLPLNAVRGPRSLFWTALDGTGRLATIPKVPVIIEVWTAWTTWTAALLLRKGISIEERMHNAVSMRIVHSDGAKSTLVERGGL